MTPEHDWTVAYAHDLTNAELAEILEYSSYYHDAEIAVAAMNMQIAALQKLLQEDGYNAADIDECVADYRAHFERPRCKPPNISIEAKPS
jgi:hypothetical protein